MQTVLHLATLETWRDAQREGELRAPSLDAEGFIHCCTEAQLAGVIDRYYRGREDLVRIVIDVEKVAADLRWEAPAPPKGASPARPASTSERFPHVYAPVPLAAIVDARALEAIR